jgi:hypothetical protein
MIQTLPASEFARLTRRAKRANKFRIAPSGERVYRGVQYASRAEACRARDLDFLVRAGDVRLWIPQPKLRLGEDVHYRPDFLVLPASGDFWAEDVKGAWTRDFTRIVKLWKKYGPCRLHVITTGQKTQVIAPQTQKELQCRE